MNRTITQKESWNGLDLTYSFEIQGEGVSQIDVAVSKNAEGASLQINRHYWRDMSFAPTQSKSALSKSENDHIEQEVRKVWMVYPDVEPLEIKEEE